MFDFDSLFVTTGKPFYISSVQLCPYQRHSIKSFLCLVVCLSLFLCFHASLSVILLSSLAWLVSLSMASKEFGCICSCDFQLRFWLQLLLQIILKFNCFIKSSIGTEIISLSLACTTALWVWAPRGFIPRV